MRVIDLDPNDEGMVCQAAALLIEAFKQHWPNAWPDLNAALEEVHESFAPDRISRLAVDDAGKVMGWIGGGDIEHYNGYVWELHPLAVAPAAQGKGVGRALVQDFEEQVKKRGGLTIWLGTDDEDNMTTLSGVDLYPNVFEHIAKIKNVCRHPYEFYQKLGFVIVGVMPDANGPGKPDIYMAKRVKA